MTSTDATDSSPWASLFPHKTENWDFLVGIMQRIIHYTNNLRNKVRDKKKFDLVTYDVTFGSKRCTCEMCSEHPFPTHH